MQGWLLLSSLLCMEVADLTTPTSPKIRRYLAHFSTSPKNSSWGHFVSLGLRLKPALLSKALPLPYRVANFLSTIPFCWGVFGAVNSKSTPRLRRSHSSLSLIFSPALLHQIYLTGLPLLRSLRINGMIWSLTWLFLARNEAKAMPVASSTAKDQYLLPP